MPGRDDAIFAASVWWRNTDRCKRNWRCLREQGVSEKYVRLVKDTYEDARTQVKTNV